MNAQHVSGTESYPTTALFMLLQQQLPTNAPRPTGCGTLEKTGFYWRQAMAVRIVKENGVFTVILHRPDVKNAVDRPTAEALVVCIIFCHAKTVNSCGA